MIEDTTGAVTGTTAGNLVISSADVRGECVFYLRHMGDVFSRSADRAKTAGVRREAQAVCTALNEAAKVLETAKIV